MAEKEFLVEYNTFRCSQAPGSLKAESRSTFLMQLLPARLSDNVEDCRHVIPGVADTRRGCMITSSTCTESNTIGKLCYPNHPPENISDHFSILDPFLALQSLNSHPLIVHTDCTTSDGEAPWRCEVYYTSVSKALSSVPSARSDNFLTFNFAFAFWFCRGKQHHMRGTWQVIGMNQQC